VDEAGEGEIAAAKRARDCPHMRSDLGYARRIGSGALERDPAPVGQRLEAVEGGVLIYAHGCVAARLNRREGAVG
jgi:hypothetical protein